MIMKACILSALIIVYVDVWKLISESTITSKKIQEESSKELQLQLLMKELQKKWSNYYWKS